MADSRSDTNEFTRYYEEHKKAIFNYILYRTGFNRDTAEDLTSEIFLKAFEHFDSYDRARPFKAWIFTIAHNHLVNHHMGKKPTLPLDDALQAAKEESYGNRVDHSALVSEVLSLITTLPDSQKDLVIMRYVNDLSNEEIARITHKEEGAVRTALSRAIATLRSEYNITFTKKNHE